MPLSIALPFVLRPTSGIAKNLSFDFFDPAVKGTPPVSLGGYAGPGAPSVFYASSSHASLMLSLSAAPMQTSSCGLDPARSLFAARVHAGG